jgi:hypothetical protein
MTNPTTPTTAPEATPATTSNNWLRSAALYLALATSPAVMTSCSLFEKKVVTPKDDPNKLTAEEQKFADILAPYPDGTPKSITVDIGDPKDPYFMPKLFKIEMKLINAKAGTLEITPIISKKPIEDAINKAKVEVPNKAQYGANIALVVKKSDGTTYSPTSTFTFIDKDDNNPATTAPAISELPENFTIDYLLKFSPLDIATMKKSYILNKSEELQLWIEVKTIGQQFATVKLPIKPVEELALAIKTGN